MRQLSFATFEHYEEAGREAMRRDDCEMARCFGCHHVWPTSELSGGFCKNCADPLPEEEGESKDTGHLDKGPDAVMSARGNHARPA